MEHVNLEQMVDRVYVSSLWLWVLQIHLTPAIYSSTRDPVHIYFGEDITPFKTICFWVSALSVNLTAIWFLNHEILKESVTAPLISCLCTEVLPFVSETQYSLELDTAYYGRYELCSLTSQKFSSTTVMKSSFIFPAFPPKIPYRKIGLLKLVIFLHSFGFIKQCLSPIKQCKLKRNFQL